MNTKLALLFLALFCSLQIMGQEKNEVFNSIQKLMDKATGQNLKSNDVFTKKDDKLGKQIFSEKEIIVNTIPEGKSNYEWITRSTEIMWNDFFDYEIYTEFKNSNLQIVELNFKKNLKKENFTSYGRVDKYPSSTSTIQFYVLSKDKKELIQLLDKIENFKTKKQESPFNAEIRKFTKQKTIDWLKENLKNTIAGSGLTSLKMISIDECNLVYEYTNFTGRKYRETLPTAIESINKYNYFTYNEKICISLSYAFGEFIQPNDETSYNNVSKLSVYSKDDDFISNIECAMKHLANYCNNSNSNKIPTTTTNNSIDKKNEDSKINDPFPMISMKDIDALIKSVLFDNNIYMNGTEYTIANVTDFANFLNKNTFAAILWQAKNQYKFELIGKTDFSKKSVEFTVKEGKLNVKANIPLNGNCDYGLKEFPVIDYDNSKTYKTGETQAYYLQLNFDYECNGIIYKYLTIYIQDETLSSYEKVKTLFATYGKK
jgi:hypothetical protein